MVTIHKIIRRHNPQHHSPDLHLSLKFHFLLFADDYNKVDNGKVTRAAIKVMKTKEKLLMDLMLSLNII